MTDWQVFRDMLGKGGPLDEAAFPPEMRSAVRDRNYAYSDEFWQPLRNSTSSPQHLFEGLAKAERGSNRLMEWIGSEGHSRKWQHPIGHMGFAPF